MISIDRAEMAGVLRPVSGLRAYRTPGALPANQRVKHYEFRRDVLLIPGGKSRGDIGINLQL